MYRHKKTVKKSQIPTNKKKGQDIKTHFREKERERGGERKREN